jgi:hypothetical protein
MRLLFGNAGEQLVDKDGKPIMMMAATKPPV